MLGGGRETVGPWYQIPLCGSKGKLFKGDVRVHDFVRRKKLGSQKTKGFTLIGGRGKRRRKNPRRNDPLLRVKKTFQGEQWGKKEE